MAFRGGLSAGWFAAETLEFFGLESPVSNAAGMIGIPWLAADKKYDLGFAHPEFARVMAWRVEAAPEPQQVQMERGDEAQFGSVVGAPIGPREAQTNSAPLKVSQTLLQELEGAGAQNVPMPLVLEPQVLLRHITHWVNTAPLTEQALMDKPVLIGYGWWAPIYRQLALAQQLYRDQKLIIVGIIPQDAATNHARWRTQLAAESVTFPVAIDDGKLTKLFGRITPVSAVMYRDDGRIHEQFTDLSVLFRVLPAVRKFIVYEQ